MTSQDFIELSQRFPQMLINIIRTVRERLFRASARKAEKRRGEEVALVTGPSLEIALGPLVYAAREVSPRPVSFPERRLSFAGALTAAEDLAAESGTVLLPHELEPERIGVLLDEVERVVAIAGNAEEAERLGKVAAARKGRLEVV